VDKKKDFIKDTVNIDIIGFDYTKFIPLLATKGEVLCSIKGNLQLPDDVSGDTVDIEVAKSLGYIYFDREGYYVKFTINGQEDESVYREVEDKRKSEKFKAGRFFNIPVKKYQGIKYIEFEITPQRIHYYTSERRTSSIPGIHMEKFFKMAESYDIKYMKTAQSRTEKTEMIPLDKFFILQRK